MTGIFRANNPLNASILFIYGLLLKFPYLLRHQEVALQSSDGFLFRDLVEVLGPAFASWKPLAPVLTYLLLFIQAITINFYVNTGRMVSRPNYLAGMSYLLITSFFPYWNVFSAGLIVNTFLIWIFGRLIMLGNAQHVKGTLFNLGFISGFCTFFYLPSVSLLLLIILSLIITRPARIVEWGMVFLGFVTVWYFLFAWLFLTDALYGFYPEGLRVGMPDIAFTPLIFVGMTLILFVFLLGAWFVQMEATKQVIQVRKRWTIVMAAAWVMLLTPLLSDNDDLSEWIMSLLFMAPLIGFAFYSIRSKWIRMALHWTMVAVVIYFEYF